MVCEVLRSYKQEVIAMELMANSNFRLTWWDSSVWLPHLKPWWRHCILHSDSTTVEAGKASKE